MEYTRKTLKKGIVETIFDYFISHLEAGTVDLPFDERIAAMLLQIAGTPACISLITKIEEYVLERCS